MDNTAILSIIWALGSAFTWGSGDFAGGLAARQHNVYSVLLTAQLVSLLPLLLLVITFEPHVPVAADLLPGSIAGLFGVVGLINLYSGLACGRMSIVTPLAAMIASLIPLLTGMLTEGIPRTLQIGGFVMALLAVWFLSSDGKRFTVTSSELRFAIFSGIGFAGVLICLDAVSGASSLWPVLIARITSVTALVLYVTYKRCWQPPAHKLLPIVALTGLLDTAGNYCFVMAGQTGRLDIVTSVASLYPAVTILLAWLLLRESLTRLQVSGAALALGAITMIAA